MQFLVNKHFDFVGKRRIAFVVSGVLILAGIVSLVIKGGPALSIDFRGGSIVELNIQPPLSVAQVRQTLLEASVDAEGVQRFGAPDEVLIYVPANPDQGVTEGTHSIREVIARAFPDRTVELRREESVGPKIGSELKTAAINSIFVALLLIVLYISIRFVFQFALGAVLALVHDVLITLGLFSLLDKEMSLSVLAAFLTIIGYSLNDTIVVFDRIRENMGLRRKESYESVINKSINETLSRTIITSLTTLLVAVILYVYGGAVIHDFAFALVVGITVGTYSSIFVASPVLIAWYNWRSADRKRLPRSSRTRVAT
jgi:preprotein translocase SecF subunit